MGVINYFSIANNDNAKGAMFMVGSMAGFVCNDALMKMVSVEVDLFQVLFIRGIVATLFLGLLAWHKGVFYPSVSTPDKYRLGYRAVGEVGSTLCFLTALFNMPLANATAILQSMPLAVTLTAAILFKHRVGWKRYVAIIIGFIGVLLIVKPGSEGFNKFSLLAVCAVFFLVIRDLSTQRLSSAVPSAFVAFFAAGLIMCVGALVTLFGTWEPVSLNNIFILFVAACFIVVGYLCAVMAMRVGDIAFVSPFRYTILIWALGLGYLVFDDIPDGLTLVGAAIVAGMGIFTFYRERRAQ